VARRASCRAMSVSNSAMAAARQLRRRFARGGVRDGAPARERVLADGEAEARLRLVADERHVGVEEVAGLCFLALGHQADHIGHHLGVGEAGHRAIGAADHLFEQELRAVAAEDRDAAGAVSSARRRVEIFSSPGQASCFSITQVG
jgi:hypothetical protein